MCRLAGRLAVLALVSITALVCSGPARAAGQPMALRLPILPSFRAWSRPAPASPPLTDLPRLELMLRGPLTARANDEARGYGARDFHRERDMTSLGVVGHPAHHGAGALCAGIGVGAFATRALVRGVRALPIRLEPTVFLGGGGLAFKARW